MKKLLCILLIVSLSITSVFALSACKPKAEETADIALITDKGNIDDKSFNEGAWNGVKAYAQANNITYAYYKPSEDSNEARVESIKTAISKGAKIVVCPGYLFNQSINDVQSDYPNVNFLILDGQPTNNDAIVDIGKNVHCIYYAEEQSGYLAGYAAVKEGYTKLGFLGGVAVPSVVRFGYGYIQGAEDAATEDNIDGVEVNHWYGNSFGPTADIKTKMDSWYTAGTEVVFACGGGIYLSATAAAEEANGKVIGVDSDQAAASETIITSAMKDLTESVKLALTSYYDNDGKWSAEEAGKIVVLGAAENSVGLAVGDSWRLENFTIEQYNALFTKVKDGTIEVSNSYEVKPTVTKIVVDYQE